jgi:hypothetical protein
VFQKGLEMVLQICVFGMGPFGDMHLLISIPRANPNSSTIKAAPLTVVTAWWSNSRPSWGDTADMTRHRVLLSSPPQACGSSRSHRDTSWCICSPNTQSPTWTFQPTLILLLLPPPHPSLQSLPHLACPPHGQGQVHPQAKGQHVVQSEA